MARSAEELSTRPALVEARSPGTRRAVAAAVVVASLLGCPCVATPPRGSSEEPSPELGPLRANDQFLLGLGFLALEPVTAEVLAAKRWQVDFSTTVANIFAASDPIERSLEARTSRLPLTVRDLRAVEGDQPGDGLFFADGEVVSTALAARRGLGRGVELEVIVPFVSFGGGVLDSAVEGVHRTLGFDQEGRSSITRDGILVYSRASRTNLLLQEEQGLSLGDIELAAKFRIGSGRGSNLWAVRTKLKLPTGDEDRLASSGGIDLGAQLVLTRRFEVSTVHAGVGLTYLAAHATLGTRAQTAFSGSAAWERRLGGKTAIVAQLAVAQSPFEDLEFRELDKTALSLTVAARRSIANQSVLVIGLTENFGSFDNSSDVAIHIGLSRGFGALREHRPSEP